MELGFTLCFIKHQDQYLMLHRKKAPNQNKWNGVGGKIEPQESPIKACLREIKEETGLSIPTVHFRGIVCWNDEGGMYVFLGESPSTDVVASNEGSLEWKSLDWIMQDDEVVSNIPLFLPPMLDFTRDPLWHHFMYNERGEIIDYQIQSLPDIPLGV